METSSKCDITLKTEPAEDVNAQTTARGLSPSKQVGFDREACKSLTESQVNELKAAFAMLDKNKDGRVNVSEMRSMLESLGICIDVDLVESLLKKATKRDDGLVSEEEFLDWMASQEGIGGSDDDDLMEDLLAAFRVFDKDGNGYITRDELKTAMDLIGERVTEAQLDEMIKATDTDNDGRINYEEFVKILL